MPRTRKIAKPPPASPVELKHALSLLDATLAATNLAELLHRLHEIVGELMPARNFYVALVDPPHRRLTFPYFVDERDTDFSPRPLGKGLTEYVMRTGQPLLVTPEVDADLLRRGEIELVGPPSIDWLGVPLRVREETLGAIVVQSYEPGIRYGEADKDLLTFVSSHVALAIERQRADAMMREGRELLHAVVEGSLDAVFAKDRDGRYLFMNTVAATVLDRRPEDVVGRRDSDLFPAEKARAFEETDRRIIETGTPLVFEDTDMAWGGTRTYLVTKGPLRLSDGRTAGVFGIARDITERKAAEEAVRRSKERYRSFIEQSTEGVSRLEFNPPVPVALPEEEQTDLLYARGIVAECNDAMARMYGFTRATELLGARLRDLHDPRDPRNREQIRAFIRSGYRLTNSETRELDRHGRGRVFLNNTVGFVEREHLVHAWGIRREVTEQRRLEEQFRQAQKMEAVGQLAGGVAHDFNNILTAILGTCQLLERELPPRTPALQDVNEIRRAALRAADLTRQLLAYSRRQVLAPKVLSLNGVVRGLEAMLRRVLGVDVELVTSLAPDLGPVRADPGQLEQVILNLVVNSRDAMPHGGRLTLATAPVELDAKGALEHPGAAPGPYATLDVRDTGTGMPPEVRAHLFEPFFTTKDVGKGTGLGLATVYGIVKQSGGFISVVTDIGAGTTFRVFLPRAEGVPMPEEAPAPAAVSDARLQGTETLLLAEDEDPVRLLSQRALESEGYTVLAAESGGDALACLERHDGPIHLLVTDVIMPGMGGRELAERLAALRPDTPVLFMSGYPGDDVIRSGALEPGAAFLQKPFMPEELVWKVREILDGGRRA